MPAILGTLGTIAFNMLMSLLTDKFIKHMVVMGAHALAGRNPEKDSWDELETALREAWNLKSTETK